MKYIKILFFVLAVTFYGSFLISKITLPAAQDLPRQMKNGEMVLRGDFDVLTKNVYSYVEPEHPFANHHWLYGVFAYLLFLGVGYNGLVLFKIILLLAMFSMLFWLSLKRSDFWLVALFSIPTILILTSRTALRPEIFSYFFTVLFLLLLLDLEKYPDKNRVFWLIPAQLIWVNTHLFFAVGVMLVGGFLFEKIVLNFKDLKKSLIVKKLTILFSALVLTMFINPFGLGGVVYSLRVNTAEDFPIGSAEINSVFDAIKNNPNWANISNFIFIPLVVILFVSFGLALFIRFKNKTPLFANNLIFYFSSSLGSTLLVFSLVRAMPLFGLIFLPAMSSASLDILRIIKEFLKYQTRSIKNFFTWLYIGVFVCSILALIIIGQTKIMNSLEQGIGLARWSLSSSRFLKENKIEGPIFNDTDSGSYLIGEFFPTEKVFTDNRFGDAYSASFFSDIYLPMIRDEDKWKEGLEKYKFNTIFFYQYDAVDGARDFIFKRIYDPEWAWVYADKYNVILIKNTPENKAVINKFQITEENLKDKLKILSDSKYPEDLLGAADVLNLAGRVDLSVPLYLQYVSLRPSVGKAWMVLGRTELTKTNQANSNPALAAIFLERAIGEGWKTWESYSYLALAYFRTGQLDRAKWAVSEELKIDPENEDGKKWLGILAEETIRLQNE